MWNKISISAVASFLFGQGVAGLLAYFGNTISALAVSIIFAIVGFGLFIYGIRKKKDTVKRGRQDNDDYAHKIIVDSKAPIVLEITDILQQLSNFEAIATNNILNKKRHLKARMLDKMQKEIQNELDIKPNYKFPIMEDTKQRELILKTMKELRLPKEYNDEYIRIFLASTWILDRYEKGITNELENDSDYITLKKNLDVMTPKLSDSKSGTAINAHRNTSLGLNSLILFQSYFPPSFKNRYVAINKSLSQWRHERDELLKMLLINVKSAMEGELTGNSS